MKTKNNRIMRISHRHCILLGVSTVFVIVVSFFIVNHQHPFTAHAIDDGKTVKDISFCSDGDCGYIATNKSDANDPKKINQLPTRGSQAVVSSLDGNYIYIFSHTDPNEGESPSYVYTFEKSGNQYNLVSTYTDLDLGHANGATYYEEGGNKYLLVATNYTYNGRKPQLVRITLNGSNYSVQEYAINPSIFIEKAYRSAVGSFSGRIIAVAYDSDRGGFYILTRGGVQELLYYPGDTLFSTDIDTVEPTILRRREDTINGVTLNAIGKSRAFEKGIPDGYVYCNQDITYYNGKIYAVGYVTSSNKDLAIQNLYIDPLLAESYISVYDIYTGDFTEIFRANKSVVQVATNQNKIDEVEDVFFIGNNMYASLQRGKSETYYGTYLLKVTADTNLYTYNHLYFRYHLNGATLTSTSTRLSICDSNKPDVVCIDGAADYTSRVYGRMTTGGRIGSGGLWNMSATKTGYHLKSGEEWSNSPDGNITYDNTTVYKVSDFVDTSLEPKTVDLYMNWKPNTYAVTLDDQNATAPGTGSVTATYDSVLPSITIPGRTYVVTYDYNGAGAETTDTATYTFGGYYTGTDGTGTQYYTTDGSSSRNWNLITDTTLFAKWTSGSVVFPTPTRSGYTFNGWYEDAAGTIAVGGGGASYTPTANITLYAKWIEDSVVTHTVTFDTSGGSSVPSLSVEDGSTINPLPTSTRTGYTFVGWFTSQTGDTKLTTSTVINNDMTYYAHWTTNNYTLTLDDQNATTPGTGSVTATYDSALPSITIPGRIYTVTYNYNGAGAETTDTAAYTFGGYYTGIDGTGTQYYTADGSSSMNWNLITNTTLFAKWTSDSVTLPTPTRSGYTFNGWHEDAAGAIAVGGGGASYTPTANITLYAEWIEIEDPVDPGDGSITYIQGRDHIILDDEDLIIKINYPLDRFSKLLFDNVELHKQYYELELGSTIITVYSEYLDSLNEGEHTLEAVYDDGASFIATMTVTKNDTIAVPDTGKNSIIEEDNKSIGFAILPIITLTLILTFYARHKRRSHIKFE